ncbi:hypothetical protein Tco_0579673 [Tanacetum coccineum]
MSSPSSSKFKVFLVYEEIKCGVSLPKNITYSNLVHYVEKKFKIGDNKQICLSYNIGSNSLNVIDDDDVVYFLKEVLESDDVVKNLFIKSFQKTLEVTRPSSSNPLDFDLNIPLFDEQLTHKWKKNTLMYMPTTPHAPTLKLKPRKTQNDGHEFSRLHIFDDKEDCMYAIGLKCLEEGYEYKVHKSDKIRDVTRVYRPKNIINNLNLELNIDVSYKRAWKAKHLALESNQGCSISSFSQLPYYCYNLKLANENTMTHIDTDDEGRFKMLFIGFGVAVSTCYVK